MFVKSLRVGFEVGGPHYVLENDAGSRPGNEQKSKRYGDGYFEIAR
jgi:hypothetical protein